MDQLCGRERCLNRSVCGLVSDSLDWNLVWNRVRCSFCCSQCLLTCSWVIPSSPLAGLEGFSWCPRSPRPSRSSSFRLSEPPSLGSRRSVSRGFHSQTRCGCLLLMFMRLGCRSLSSLLLLLLAALLACVSLRSHEPRLPDDGCLIPGCLLSVPVRRSPRSSLTPVSNRKRCWPRPSKVRSLVFHRITARIQPHVRPCCVVSELALSVSCVLSRCRFV